jgi:hypothetical protein
MKILKQVDVANWKYVYTCSHCESELEVEANDVQHRHLHAYLTDVSDLFFCTCPVCHKEHPLSTNKIPKLLQVQIREKGKPNLALDNFR